MARYHVDCQIRAQVPGINSNIKSKSPRRTIIKQKNKLFRVNSETGVAFRAVAELMNIDGDELLQELMSSYVASVQCSIADIAYKYPAFSDRFPFVEAPQKQVNLLR
jgi:hypothetical protein